MANNQSTKPIFVENAEIKQMAVTINVMSVNKKQMTLSVFRQLPCADIIDESGDLDEDFLLWGIVRYSFNNSDVWALGSYDGELYRSAINPRRHRNIIDNLRVDIQQEVRNEKRFEDWVRSVLKRETLVGQEIIYVNGHTLSASAIYNNSGKDKYLYEARSYFKNHIDWMKDEIVRHKRIIRSLEQLMELTQLFIAV